MPPPPPGWARGDPNRDYQLLPADDVEAAAQQAQPVAPRRLFQLARPERWRLSAASLFLLAGSLGQVAFPKLAGDLIDVAIRQQAGGSPEEARRTANRILAQVLVIVAAAGAADGVRSWLFGSAAERVMYRLRVRLYSALLRQEVGFFDRVRTGELANRLSEDTRLLKAAATTSLAQALRAAAVCAAGLAMMFATSWQLAALALCVLPPLFILFWLFGRLSRRFVREQLAASAAAAALAEESLAGLRTVRSFAKEAAAGEAYAEAQSRTLRYGLRSAALEGFFLPFNGALATAAIMAVLWHGARQVIAGRLTAGRLSAFVVYAVYVAGNAGMLLGVMASVVQALGAAERVFQLLDRQPGLELPEGGLTPCGAPEGAELRLEDVWFAYPSRPGLWVLSGLCLRVAPGQTVALVGRSGGGKSTVVALAQRFYDPQRGAVLLDGAPLPAVDHAWLHRQAALVSQEPLLFAGTIADNIAFGCLAAAPPPPEALEAAARAANAHDFVAALPQGYQTRVGERGVRLSGGQKQRIAIARALILNPRLLLLDEATSALDAESEHLVQEALGRAASGRSVLVVAHRLSTVRGADVVAVVQAGRVAQSGTHAQLLAAGGPYEALVRRQLLMGDGGGGGDEGSTQAFAGGGASAGVDSANG